MRAAVAIALAAAAVALLPAAAGAAEPIEGTWSVSGGAVSVVATAPGTFAGTVTAPTKFSACVHEAGQRMWELTGAGTRYTGTHDGFELGSCAIIEDLPATWDVQEQAGKFTLTMCVTFPEDGRTECNTLERLKPPPPSTVPSTTPDTVEPPPLVTCAVEGRVTDYQGRGVPGIHVQASYGDGLIADAATDAGGRYRFPRVHGEVIVRLIAEEGGGPRIGRFRVLFRERQTVLETIPFRVERGSSCRRDLPLDGRESGYVLINPAGAEGVHWRALGSIYQRLRRAADYAESLGVRFDYGLPLTVYAWCDDPVLRCGPDAPSPAFYVGTNAGGQVVKRPYIALLPAASRLMRGRADATLYHEFGHAVLADAFGNALPWAPGDGNHLGYYENRWSTDSWTEGFANFFAVMVAKHVDRGFLPEHFNTNGYVKDIEWDWSAWNGLGREEEWALAGLLLDFEDGPGDYRAGRARADVAVRWGKADLNGRRVIAGNVPHPPPGDLTVAVELFDRSGRRVLARRAFYRDGFFLLPVPKGVDYRSVRIKVLDGPYGVEHDDDPLDLDPVTVWKAILDYGARKGAASSGSSYPHVSSAFQLYRALDRAFGGTDRDGDGQKDVAQIFRAHGFFADRNGNLTPDRGETVGMTSHPAYRDGALAFPELDPRYAAELLPQQGVAIDAGEALETETIVFVGFPGEHEPRSYAYATVPGADGGVPVAVPPADSGATVTLVTLAEGHVPAVVAELDAAEFWQQAAEHSDEAFLRYPVALEPGALELETGGGGAGKGQAAVMLLAGGGLAIAGAALLLVRRRVTAS